MADDMEQPPPLFENVNIIKTIHNEQQQQQVDDEDYEDDDLFVSTVQGHQQLPSLPTDGDRYFDNDAAATNGTSIGDLKRLSLGDEKDEEELETVPIDNDLVTTMVTPTLEELNPDSSDHYVTITITQPQKIGEGMSSYMAYRVTTRTNMPMFKGKEFAVTRRFSDFLGLHDKLTEKYLKVGRIIPPAPEKSVLGNAKMKMSSGSGGHHTDAIGTNGEFVERRRAALERYLRRTAEHPVLVLDPDFREFLESDTELPKATSTSALSGAGVMRLFNKVGETVNKITYKMDETDPWFEDKLIRIESLETQLRKLHANVDTLVAYRRELANLTNGVSRSAAMLSATEDHNSLSRALSQLAETEEKVEALHVEQANVDFFVLCEFLKDYVGLLGAVKEAFHERTKLFQLWQHAQTMLTRKREQKTKYELHNRLDKKDQAGVEVIEWEAKVERGQENFEKISKMIKMEMDRFERCRVDDFKSTFIRYLENHVAHQSQTIKLWESFLPEAKAIA